MAGDRRRPASTALAAANLGGVYPRRTKPRAELLLREERQVELKPLALTDFHHRPMLGLYCRQHRQLIKLEKLLREGGVTLYEADIRPPERYLMERFITAPVWFNGGATAMGRCSMAR